MLAELSPGEVICGGGCCVESWAQGGEARAESQGAADPAAPDEGRAWCCSHGLRAGCALGSEGGRFGSGGVSLISVRTLGGVIPFDTISMTSLKDRGYAGASEPGGVSAVPVVATAMGCC